MLSTEETNHLVLRIGFKHEEFIVYFIASLWHQMIITLSWFVGHNPIGNGLSSASPLPQYELFDLNSCTSKYESGSLVRIDSKFIPQSLVSIKTDSYLATHSTDSTSLKKKNGNFTYKCLIDMQGGACSPFGHINGLAKLELETLRSYIHENHKKGFIQQFSLQFAMNLSWTR